MIRYDARRSAAAWAGAPVLLLDETLIQEQHGIRREVQVGSKRPMLVAPDRDKPWEYCGAGMSKRIHLYGTVLYDDLMGKYRMWYMGRMGPHWRFPVGNYQIPGLYIPRTDERPYHCNGVTHDRHGRALQTNDRGDLTLYADSDDGLAWVRAGTMRWPGAATARCVPSTTTCPRSATTTSISAWWERCTYARRRSPTRKNQMPCDGPIDAQLVYSRDGLSWSHADRERTPVIPRGAGHAFDRGMIIGTAKEPVIEGDAIHWYYTGCEHGHGETDLEKRVKYLARATWRRDRFVALYAPEAGAVTTKPVSVPPGARGLTVNADAAGGQAVVELCAPDGTVLEGFSHRQCVPLRGDELDWRVSWNGADLSAVGGAVQIRFLLTRSRLYSYRWS